MDTGIRKAQQRVFEALAQWKGCPFVLGGGTALELYYLKHRFSRDIDLFAKEFGPAVLEEAENRLGKALGKPLIKQREFVSPARAMVVFYTAEVEPV